MEEKKAAISSYLRNVVNPILQPMVQQMATQRPTDIIRFMDRYIQGLLKNQKKEEKHQTDEEEENQDAARQLQKKIAEKKKKKAQKKHSRQGISAEVFGKYNEKKQFKPRVIEKNQETIKQIQQLISRSILFQNLNKEDKEVIINAMEEKKTKANQQIIKEGQQGDVLYLVSQGQFQCFKFLNQKETYLKTYHSGESFGQLALMYNAPRAATIKSKVQGKLYALDRQTFINIVQEAATKKRSSYLSVLSKVQILGEVDPYQKEQICDILKEEQYEAGQYIMKQGDEGSRFYIVAEGILIAQKNENSVIKKVFDYKQGDYFGEIALVRDTVRQASVKAQTNCRVVYIERDAFKRILGPIEEILKRNEEKYKKYAAQ